MLTYMEGGLSKITVAYEKGSGPERPKYQAYVILCERSQSRDRTNEILIYWNVRSSKLLFLSKGLGTVICLKVYRIMKS